MAFYEKSEIYRRFLVKNQRRLFDFCDDCIEFLEEDISLLNPKMILAMHYHSMIFLLDNAGEYRDVIVEINKSDHIPPNTSLISELMVNFINEIKLNWNKSPYPFDIAAFALWRLNWIHPFEDGNGRISRALAYTLLSAKIGNLSISQPLPIIIKQNQNEFFKLLKITDKNYGTSASFNPENHKELAEFLEKILDTIE